jgi:nitroreductase
LRTLASRDRELGKGDAMTDREMPSHHGVAAPPEDRPYPNETIRLLTERASCRSFSDKEIPPDVLRLVLEAGIHAATGGNLQPYSIVKIEDGAVKEALAERCGQAFIGKAPVLLVFCIDWHRIERWAHLEIAPFTASSSFRHFWVSFQDTVICAQSICTAADALGLGSVYIGTILEFLAELCEMLKLPSGVFPVVLLCLGYPSHKPPPRRKLGVDVIVHSERYHEMEDQELLEAFDQKYPGHIVQITEERLSKIAQVCQQAHGDEFAQECVKKIEETGYIIPVQRYFGLHYRANEMPQGNEAYLKLMEESGFHWFSEWLPVGDREAK